MPQTTTRILISILTASLVFVAAQFLGYRISEYAAQEFVGSNQFDPRGMLPWLNVVVFAVLLALARLAAPRQVTFLSLMAALATVLVTSHAIYSFLIFPADVGQPPWEPATGRNFIIMVVWTAAVWAAVGLFARNQRHSVLVLALGLIAVELAAIPFLQPIWSELQ